MERRIRIGIVDDHPLFLEGVVFALEFEPDIDIVAQGGSADEAFKIAQTLGPDLLLVDLVMPGGGINAIKRIAHSYPSVKTLVMTAQDDDEQICKAYSYGAHGYLLKGAGSKELVETIRLVSSGGRHVPSNFTARSLLSVQGIGTQTELHSKPWPVFTTREEQILAQIVQQKTNDQVGQDLGMSGRTVKHYLKGIFQKLDVKTRDEAASLAQAYFRRETK